MLGHESASRRNIMLTLKNVHVSQAEVNFSFKENTKTRNLSASINRSLVTEGALEEWLSFKALHALA